MKSCILVCFLVYTLVPCLLVVFMRLRRILGQFLDTHAMLVKHYSALPKFVLCVLDALML